MRPCTRAVCSDCGLNVGLFGVNGFGVMRRRHERRCPGRRAAAVRPPFPSLLPRVDVDRHSPHVLTGIGGEANGDGQRTGDFVEARQGGGRRSDEVRRRSMAARMRRKSPSASSDGHSARRHGRQRGGAIGKGLQHIQRPMTNQYTWLIMVAHASLVTTYQLDRPGVETSVSDRTVLIFEARTVAKRFATRTSDGVKTP